MKLSKNFKKIFLINFVITILLSNFFCSNFKENVNREKNKNNIKIIEKLKKFEDRISINDNKSRNQDKVKIENDKKKQLNSTNSSDEKKINYLKKDVTKIKNITKISSNLILYINYFDINLKIFILI